MGTDAALRVPSTDCWNGFFDTKNPIKLYKDVNGRQIEKKIPLIPDDPGSRGIFYEKFLSCVEAVRNNGEAPVSSKEIFINQILLDSIVKSSELKREIEINIPVI